MNCAHRNNQGYTFKKCWCKNPSLKLAMSRKSKEGFSATWISGLIHLIHFMTGLRSRYPSISHFSPVNKENIVSSNVAYSDWQSVIFSTFHFLYHDLGDLYLWTLREVKNGILWVFLIPKMVHISFDFSINNAGTLWEQYTVNWTIFCYRMSLSIEWLRKS